MPLPGRSNLMSQTGEAIQISFSGFYSGSSPGGGGSGSIEARNLQCTLTVPAGRPLPSAFIWAFNPGALSATLVKNGNVYTGAISSPVSILYISSGRYIDLYQYHDFIPIGSNSQGGPLIDPINGTSTFQTVFYYASGFAATPSGLWPVG